MRTLLNKKNLALIISLVLFAVSFNVYAADEASDESSIDRVELVTQQINLLKSRYQQSENELASLQKQHDDQISRIALEKASKSLLDKAALDISVAKSNADSINIELTDTQQTISWLEKNVQEIENQINVLGIFGSRVAKTEVVNQSELETDLKYQQQLLMLEKERVDYLQKIQTSANNILQLKKEKLAGLTTMLKSHRLLHIKQQQVKDELAYQQEQNYWLSQLNTLYARLEKIDPAKSTSDYAATERDIYCANENANYAYVQSLIARYKDQIQQMKLSILRGNSISMLNEMTDQVQVLAKQMDKLDEVLKSRIKVLNKHINFLSQKYKNNLDYQPYLAKLSLLATRYNDADVSIEALVKNVASFRISLDRALQEELSSRQGLPSIEIKSFIDLGKEAMLVPKLTFQMVRGLSTYLTKSIEETRSWAWFMLALIEAAFVFLGFMTHRFLHKLISRPSEWKDKLNTKWLSLQVAYRHFASLMVILNLTAIFYFFDIPWQSYLFIVYLLGVWVVFNCIATISRLCLLETVHNSEGRDVKLYQRLKGLIWVGAIVTAVTVFAHQLPLIYELKMMSDRLFLACLMMVSLMLLRSWDVVPKLILSHIETQNRYFENSIKLFGLLVPVLMFANSFIGMIGYVNLVMTISWYEGVFLLVLIAYLLLRGLLSDGVLQLSRLTIQYVNNGWLWTEAFLKPLDKILRISLFLLSWAALFLLYGWDKQSPIVERFTRLLHYQLISVLNTTISPLSVIELCVVISVFYWTAKWTREFVYRLLASRTDDMGIRNTIAILSQYTVIFTGGFLCLRVLDIDFRVLAAVTSMFALGIGLGLRDLANNFVCGFLILFERPLRVGDIVSVNNVDGEVMNIGSRAITIRTWDHTELVVPNTEIFSKAFTNWTSHDNIIRTVVKIKINRSDNPHQVRDIIRHVLVCDVRILKDPAPEVYLDDMSDTLMQFQVRYHVDIRKVKSKIRVMSDVLISIWDEFDRYGIKPPFSQHEVMLRQQDLQSVLTPRENDLMAVTIKN